MSPADSPALREQSDRYPPVWRGRVPLRVRMATTVRPDVPTLIEQPSEFAARSGHEYEVWVNSHGAVAAILPAGNLGLRPYEFEVIAWHGQQTDAPSNSCNRHNDCAAADAAARAKGSKFGADHCYDDCCEECFGN